MYYVFEFVFLPHFGGHHDIYQGLIYSHSVDSGAFDNRERSRWKHLINNCSKGKVCYTAGTTIISNSLEFEYTSPFRGYDIYQGDLNKYPYHYVVSGGFSNLRMKR